MRRHNEMVRRAWVLMVLAVAMAAGCSPKPTESAGVSGGPAPGAPASLLVISTDVTVQGSGKTPSPGSSGQPLNTGDTVRTDPTGFAEVGFADGSLARVENAAEFTLTELAKADNVTKTRTDLRNGDGWHHVQPLTDAGDSYQVDTPVASATVRGTSFTTSCRGGACDFSVVEGTVELRLPDGTTITLRAGDRVALQSGKPPPAVEHAGVGVLERDPWIAKNRKLDREKSGPATPGATPVKLKKPGVLTVCASASSAGYSFIGAIPSGPPVELRGLNIDLLRAIAADRGLTLELLPSTITTGGAGYDDRVKAAKAVRESECDTFALALSPAETNDLGVLATNAYTDRSFVVLAPTATASKYSDASSLPGVTVELPSDAVVQRLAAQQLPGAKLQVVDDSTIGVDLGGAAGLGGGTVDNRVFLLDAAQARWGLDRMAALGMGEPKITVVFALAGQPLVLPTAPGNEGLRDALNEALDHLGASGRLQEILDRWTPGKAAGGSPPASAAPGASAPTTETPPTAAPTMPPTSPASTQPGSAGPVPSISSS